MRTDLDQLQDASPVLNWFYVFFAIRATGASLATNRAAVAESQPVGHDGQE